MKKELKNYSSFLTYSVILHLFSLICSVYRDTYKWSNGYREINYWLLFFSWWCTQTSLITIIYFVYQKFKSKPPNYFDKVFDLIVINANLIAISVFTMGAILGTLPLPKSSEIINIFGWKVSSRVFWWFYSLIWHYLAPFLTLVYFKQRKVDLGNTYQSRRKLFFYSFLHPLGYFGMVLFRPLIPGSQNYLFSKELPHYPYFFFEWVGMRGVKQFLWTLLVVFFWMLVFWASALFFWKFTKQKITK